MGCRVCTPSPAGAATRSLELRPHHGLQKPLAWGGEGWDPARDPGWQQGELSPPSPRHPGPSRGSIPGCPVPPGGDAPPPGDARLPWQRDVPLLGATPAMPSAPPAPGGRTEGWGWGGTGQRSHPGPHVPGKQEGLVPEVRGRHPDGLGQGHLSLISAQAPSPTAQRGPFPTHTPAPGCPSSSPVVPWAGTAHREVRCSPLQFDLQDFSPSWLFCSFQEHPCMYSPWGHHPTMSPSSLTPQKEPELGFVCCCQFC